MSFNEEALCKQRRAEKRLMICSALPCFGIKFTYTLQFFVAAPMISMVCRIPFWVVFLFNAFTPFIGLITPPVVGFINDSKCIRCCKDKHFIIAATALTELGLFLILLATIVFIPGVYEWHSDDGPRYLVALPICVGIVLMDIGLNIAQVIIRRFVNQDITSSYCDIGPRRKNQLINSNILYTTLDSLGMLACSICSVIGRLVIFCSENGCTVQKSQTASGSSLHRFFRLLFWVPTKTSRGSGLEEHVHGWFYFSMTIATMVCVFVTFITAVFTIPRSSSPQTKTLKNQFKTLYDLFKAKKRTGFIYLVVLCGWMIYSPFQSITTTLYSFCSMSDTHKDSLLCSKEEDDVGVLLGQFSVTFVAKSQTLSPVLIRFINKHASRSFDRLNLNVLLFTVSLPPLLIMFSTLVWVDYLKNLGVTIFSIVIMVFVGPFYTILNSLPFAVMSVYIQDYNKRKDENSEDHMATIFGVMNAFNTLGQSLSNFILGILTIFYSQLIWKNEDGTLDASNTAQIAAVFWCGVFTLVMSVAVFGLWTPQATNKGTTTDQSDTLYTFEDPSMVVA